MTQVVAIDALCTPCVARLVFTVAIETWNLELADVVCFLRYLLSGYALGLVDYAELLLVRVFCRVEGHLWIRSGLAGLGLVL